MSWRLRIGALACLGLLGACGADGAAMPDAGGGGRSGGTVDAGPVPGPVPRQQCGDDSHCDDGNFCNGIELCMPGADTDDRGCVAGASPCTALQLCDEGADSCVALCEGGPDADGDGHDATACGGDDCDDRDPDRFPGNPEVCDPDGHDEDCDSSTHGARDHDGDGEDDAQCCNLDEQGAWACGLDCDDFRRNVHGNSTEECDGVDNDCDGETDEGVLVFGYADNDHDLHGDPRQALSACPGASAFATEGDDCDDGNPARHGAMQEFCDDIDNDCDGSVDEETQSIPWYPDLDGDGFGDRGAGSTMSCEPIEDHVVLATDCDDGRPAVNPASRELCDGRDNDCDSEIDEGVKVPGYADADGDGFGEMSKPQVGCPGARGFAQQGGDCDDGRLDRFPNRVESCDSLDNDCDGEIDEGVVVSGFVDADRDLHGDPGRPIELCQDTAGFSLLGDDCDDGDPSAHPAQAEFCDEIDNDCDGSVDENVAAVTWYRDADGDGYGDPRAETRASCGRPDGYVLLPLDCDDRSAGINPGSPELCDGIDNDCNGRADYRIGVGNGEDDDGDGAPDLACPGLGSDCDDWNAANRPGASELCDGIDNDCDGETDEELDAVRWYADLDGDGYGDTFGDQLVDCEAVRGYSATPGDCDDSTPEFSPGVRDLCDGKDNDCDGRLDEDALLLAFYPDADGDGAYGGFPVLACEAPEGHGDVPADCAPLDPGRHPGVAESCNGVDEDCDEQIDEGTLLSGFADRDGDTRGDPDTPVMACAGSAGFSQQPDDCDDENPAVNGTQTEICDDIDNDCDEMVDEDEAPANWYSDVDGDGFGSDQEAPINSCEPVAGYSLLDSDCNDDNRNTFPAARERCDGADNDCDGRADEGLRDLAPEACDGERDEDCDGVVDEGCECTAGDGRRCETGLPGRCADGIQVCSDIGRWSQCQERVAPATEACGGGDDDCDGSTDEGLVCP